MHQLNHKVDVYTADGTEIKKVRMKTTQFICLQCQNDGAILNDEKLNPAVDDLIDLCDNFRYYSGILFMPSISVHVVETGRMSITAEASQ